MQRWLWHVFTMAVCFALSGASPAYSNEASGTLRFDHCPAWYRLTLTHIDAPEQTISFSFFAIWDGVHEKDWFDVLSEADCAACTSPIIKRSRIRIKNLSNRSISGDFAVDFADGRTVTGPFHAKRVRTGKIICA